MHFSFWILQIKSFDFVVDFFFFIKILLGFGFKKFFFIFFSLIYKILRYVFCVLDIRERNLVVDVIFFFLILVFFFFFFLGTLNPESVLKRIRYEIRLGEPNRPMSMGQKKVEPILCVEPLTERRPRLAHHVSDS